MLKALHWRGIPDMSDSARDVNPLSVKAQPRTPSAIHRKRKCRTRTLGRERQPALTPATMPTRLFWASGRRAGSDVI